MLTKISSVWEIKNKPVYLEIEICSHAKIKKLKVKYFGIDQTTDVLSFPKVPKKLWKILPEIDLGKIVINWSMAEEVAKTLQKKPIEIVLIYLVHGITHCLGYDHERDSKFFDEEKKLLKAIGVKKSLREIMS